MRKVCALLMRVLSVRVHVMRTCSGRMGAVRCLASSISCRLIAVFTARQVRTQKTQVQHKNGEQGGGEAAEHMRE